MTHSTHLRMTERLAARLDAKAPGQPGVPSGEVPAYHYTSRDHFERERDRIFRRQPNLVGLASEFLEPGACAARDLAGVGIVVARGRDRVLRAFRNACRHRSTELVAPGAAGVRKAIVCPYHGWTYDLSGELIDAPHAPCFEGRDRERRRLTAAYAATRHGLVWAGLEPFDLAEVLAPIDEELTALDIDAHVLYRRSVREVGGNWKLVIDAFLDAYHIRTLHRRSIYRFFHDAMAESEPAGVHVRAVTARRGLAEVRAELAGVADLRQVVTPSYVLFPNVVVIVHPDYLSILTAAPLAVDRTRFEHLMLIPQAPSSEAEAEHWQRSFELIDREVFDREDLRAVEAMQRGLETGANESQLFGTLEGAALWFHQTLADLMAAPSVQP